jgi:hypothetical protein
MRYIAVFRNAGGQRRRDIVKVLDIGSQIDAQFYYFRQVLLSPANLLGCRSLNGFNSDIDFAFG